MLRFATTRSGWSALSRSKTAKRSGRSSTSTPSSSALSLPWNLRLMLGVATNGIRQPAARSVRASESSSIASAQNAIERPRKVATSASHAAHVSRSRASYDTVLPNAAASAS